MRIGNTTNKGCTAIEEVLWLHERVATAGKAAHDTQLQVQESEQQCNEAGEGDFQTQSWVNSVKIESLKHKLN